MTETRDITNEKFKRLIKVASLSNHSYIPQIITFLEKCIATPPWEKTNERKNYDTEINNRYESSMYGNLNEAIFALHTCLRIPNCNIIMHNTKDAQVVKCIDIEVDELTYQIKSHPCDKSDVYFHLEWFGRNSPDILASIDQYGGRILMGEVAMWKKLAKLQRYNWIPLEDFKKSNGIVLAIDSNIMDALSKVTK